MTDTAEYWNDVKRHFRGLRPTYVCLKNLVCAYETKYETKKITNVTCRSCKEIIGKTPLLAKRLEDSERSRRNSIKESSGYKLTSQIKFGKYKQLRKTIQWIIDNDNRYFQWLVGVIVVHPELDKFIIKKTTNND